MRKAAAICGLALAAMAPAVASAADNTIIVGVSDKGLASKALAAGDYQVAARRLEALRSDFPDDPARLINLGNAYAGMGKAKAARNAYQAARFAPDAVLVTADGQEGSSREIARKAIGRLQTSYAMR
ncbi:tetratricopeptide repeat protein [Sphingobium sp. PNB]|uniref:tetratricopeptide repeat protein n=1 Tax=Sphingobium sp. PNB TaxID=863934 RepID=UPI001CA46AFB|nr:tetratricopeptide repeat protein [Sphingobium sp. PNB]MCB4862146.1 tetratricopeptide repeat protein [Sphingobium sp. PNB]